jgi:hypothetical protein
MHPRYKRKCLLVDRKVQGALLLRVVGYWLACVATIEFLNLSWQIATGPEQPTFVDYYLNQDWRSVCFRLVASLLLLGPITFDMLRLSNRFAGPVFRMQRELKQIAQGGKPEPIRLRDNDYWHDFADDLNAALARLSHAAAPQSAAAEKVSPENPHEEPVGSVG